MTTAAITSDPDALPPVGVQRLVGRVGEFTTAAGHVCQCRVTGIDYQNPFEREIPLLIIEYVTPDGRKITGAVIGVEAFRADATPNAGGQARESDERCPAPTG